MHAVEEVRRLSCLTYGGAYCGGDAHVDVTNGAAAAAVTAVMTDPALALGLAAAQALLDAAVEATDADLAQDPATRELTHQQHAAADAHAAFGMHADALRFQKVTGRACCGAYLLGDH